MSAASGSQFPEIATAPGSVAVPAPGSVAGSLEPIDINGLPVTYAAPITYAPAPAHTYGAPQTFGAPTYGAPQTFGAPTYGAPQTFASGPPIYGVHGAPHTYSSPVTYAAPTYGSPMTYSAPTYSAPTYLPAPYTATSPAEEVLNDVLSQQEHGVTYSAPSIQRAVTEPYTYAQPSHMYAQPSHMYAQPVGHVTYSAPHAPVVYGAPPTTTTAPAAEEGTSVQAPAAGTHFDYAAPQAEQPPQPNHSQFYQSLYGSNLPTAHSVIVHAPVPHDSFALPALSSHGSFVSAAKTRDVTLEDDKEEPKKNGKQAKKQKACC